MFGSKHLIGLGVMAGLMIMFFLLMHFFVNKRGENARRWALRGIYIFLITLEVIKYIYLLASGIAIDHGNFPWQLCSMPLYLFPIVAFGKGKIAEFVKPAAFTIGLLAGTLTILYPSNVLGEGMPWLENYGLNFPSISFFYHTTMIVFAIYMLVSKVYKPKASDVWKALVIMFGVALVAIALNAIIPGADYFLLGVGHGNPLAVIIEKTNLFVYDLVMILVASAVVCLLYSYWIVKAIVEKIKNRPIKF